MRPSPGLLIAMVFSLALPAQEPEGAWKLKGFGTLGLVWNSTSRAQFTRDVSQPGGATRSADARVDTRLGLQLDGTLADTLQAGLQVLGKYRYDATFTPEIAWAYLGWSPVPELQVRAGRLGVELFMNADSRDVGYSYLWVRPPVECFGLIPVTRLDGMDATGTIPLGRQATLRLKAFYGATSEKLPLAGMPPLSLAGDRIGGLVTEVQTGAWRLRLAAARFAIYTDFPGPVGALPQDLGGFAQELGDPGLAQTAAELRFSGGAVRWYSAGLSREDGPLQVQGMLNRMQSDRVVLPPSWAGYLSLGYRFGQVVPYGLWSRICSRHSQVYLGQLPEVPQAAPLLQGVDFMVDANPDTQSTTAAGLRWDFQAKAALKFQLERIQTRLPNSLWYQAQPQWNGQATVASAVLDFVF
jgi:hypothetical protein